LQRAVIIALGSIAVALPAAMVPAQLMAAPAAKAQAASYKAPRNAYGQPDLSGYWSNATLTPLVRPAKLGDRKAYTEDEVKALEHAVVQEVEEGNKPTDPNAPAEAPKVDPAKIRPEFAAAGGDVGGYNRGWLDPGSAVMRVGGEPRTSILTTPNGQVPARKTAAGGAGGRGFGGGMGSFDNPENRSLGERCIIGFGRNGGPPMFANGFYNNDYYIIQSKDAVVIQVEMNHDIRTVRLNSKHRTDDVRPYFGDSIGWWEGDTLVVETDHIPAQQQFMGAWKTLKVTERFTRTAKDRVRYSFVVDDPNVWEKPWGGEYEFAPMQGIIYEYACHEGNYALPGMLAGARHQEAEGGAKPASKGSD
jgi:hypothetical protein